MFASHVACIDMLERSNIFLPFRNQDQEKGNFIQNILDQIDDDHTNNVSNQGGFFDQDVYSVDKTLVDLVTGGETDRIGQILKKIERDSDASLSDEFSDTEDPIHEDSLLTDLFYTGKDVCYLLYYIGVGKTRMF